MLDDVVFTKAQRLSRISYFLYHNPRGLTVAELARLCNTNERAIRRDLSDLEKMGIPLWQDESKAPRHGIIKGYYIPPIRLTLDDALTLYQAARLLARYADSPDAHMAEALAKLAAILPDPISQYVHATIRDIAERQRGGEGEHLAGVLRALALGWGSGRVVHIHYRPADSDEIRETDLHPYAIEPSPIGHATYVIGHARHANALRTYKVERIIKAELTAESFAIPEDFDAPALLRTAWGIMYGEQTEEVVLRFVPGATRRVQESRWHPSQRLETCDDGGCVLRLTISHPEEMRYWIRGWGPQVEVLAPGWLREEMAREARELAAVYQGG